MQAAPSISPFQTQTGSNAAANTSAKAAAGDNSALDAVDFQNFLTLLTAQLRNQDPLDPADSTEFVAQLAQFTSVEQLVVANSKLDSIASAMVADGIDKFAGWIGREAEAKSAPAYFDGENPVNYRLSGNPDAARVETVVANQFGQEITRFGSLNGSSVQSWNGLASNGAPAQQGAYAITAIYYASDGTALSEEIANTFGGVREVRLNDGGAPAIVFDGGVEVTPDQVVGLGLKE